MFIWDKDNIRWMEAAAEKTGYYEKLARIIQPFLKKEDQVCEIGCGLGHFACAISTMVANITAVDISKQAIERVKAISDSRGIKNMKPMVGDWIPLAEVSTRKFDVVVLSYISAIRKNWDELCKLSRGPIIAILANGESGTGLQSSLYNPIYDDLEGRDTIVNVVPFLESQGIQYKLIECELEYGQPLESMEDACNFISRYYKGSETELMNYLCQRLIPQYEGYYLPKIKKSGILIIDGTKKL